MDALLWDNKYHTALTRMANVLYNDTLDDFTCVDQIVSILEELGFDCGDRHGFG